MQEDSPDPSSVSEQLHDARHRIRACVRRGVACVLVAFAGNTAPLTFETITAHFA